MQSHLWIPRVPTHENLAVGVLEPSKVPRAFRPLFDFDFGGHHGVLLSSLTRIVVRMVSNSCPIIGIDIFYTDRCIRFDSGWRGGTELSFFIGGPGGERITSMEITFNDPESGVRGLQVWTHNFINTSPRKRLLTLSVCLRSQQIMVVACYLLPCVNFSIPQRRTCLNGRQGTVWSLDLWLR